MEDRLRGALWGFFAGDALAAPTHWYYGGATQIKADYGIRGITDYTKPKTKLSGSILNKSNINGGGRGSFQKTSAGISIIGDVINHGKRDLWDPNKQIHYHATLQAGENTLEAQLARVLMKSIVANDGKFNADHFRSAYIKFMTTPGSHNDTYASTCHRMFFSNLKLGKLDPKDCPDNDMHNVDTIDGLVLPTITALAMTARGESSDVVAQSCAATAGVTRRSSALEQVARAWSSVVSAAVKDSVSNEQLVDEYLPACATEIGLSRKPNPRSADQMTACYLEQSFPPTLDSLAKYVPEGGLWKGLLANANVGGENVHRGSLLGAVLGARSGLPNLPEQLRKGLYEQSKLSEEIDSFVKAVVK
eukprot:CAMPEP_0194034656 /NCGR_PEP_ID=MMETSP0009_2-20130614/7087_1 /TAXON_ID=210454 /ORGANISM="Grammatophora oceanica, Strain CCMP 410" /LENGTH=361 /DNA_ID=CAMNT_0038675679 /DNA_START=126 /DNA_END=1211 /DNA_ORIENTATION=+